MGSISIPIAGYVVSGATVAATAGALGAAASAYSMHQAGVATANEDKVKARQATIDATQKQIDMRQQMLRALASQNANAGQGGIGTGGSFGANVNRQITQNQDDLLVTGEGGQVQGSLYGIAAGAAQTTGNIGAAGSILGGVKSFLDS